MRVVDRSEGRVLGRTAHGKFIQIGFSDDDCAGFFEPPDHRRSVGWEIVLEDARSTGCSHALSAEIVFDGKGNAGKGLLTYFISDCSVHRCRTINSSLTIDRDVRIEPLVISFDAFERCA